VTAARALSTGSPATALTPRAVIAAWRGITRGQLVATLVLGGALSLYHFVVGPPPGGLRAWPIAFALDQIRVFALLLAIVVAERATEGNPDRFRAYAFAVVTGAAAGATASVYAREVLYALWMPQIRPFPRGLALYHFGELVMLGGAVVWVVLDRRRAARARGRMHAAELERIAAERRALESDLQAMQARVEPQFLFNTLSQVRHLYEHDPALGERMLDELIAYLRAAMPRMRDTSSTLGQEIQLVHAYLGIVRLRLGERLEFEIETPPQITDARVPPMMLLPLVYHAIAHGLAESHTNGKIRIRTAVADEKVRLEIVDSGAGFLPGSAGDSIAGIHERLAALYAARASLVLREREDGATEAVMEIPLEAASAAPHHLPTRNSVDAITR